MRHIQMRNLACCYVKGLEMASGRSRVLKVLRKHEWILVLLAVVGAIAAAWLVRVVGIALGVTFGATLA